MVIGGKAEYVDTKADRCDTGSLYMFFSNCFIFFLVKYNPRLSARSELWEYVLRVEMKMLKLWEHVRVNWLGTKSKIYTQ